LLSKTEISAGGNNVKIKRLQNIMEIMLAAILFHSMRHFKRCFVLTLSVGKGNSKKNQCADPYCQRKNIHTCPPLKLICFPGAGAFTLISIFTSNNLFDRVIVIPRHLKDLFNHLQRPLYSNTYIVRFRFAYG
jgi:hypothetical protein